MEIDGEGDEDDSGDNWDELKRNEKERKGKRVRQSCSSLALATL
jgi:hypothetical protein